MQSSSLTRCRTDELGSVLAVKFPQFVTASKWATTFTQLWELVMGKRGKHLATYPGGPTLAPELTNGDVVRLVMGWLAAIGPTKARELFPLWYQFAAAAYGWDPKTDKLDASAKRRDAAYPDLLLVEFWKAQMALAHDLDDASVPNARIDLDGDFADRVFQAEVQAALKQDGAEAAFKIPTPVCKNPDGSKTIGPKCKRYMKTWPYFCEEWERCEPDVVDDPITVVKKRAEKTLWLVALAIAAWWAFDNRQQRPRRRRARYGT